MTVRTAVGGAVALVVLLTVAAPAVAGAVGELDSCVRMGTLDGTAGPTLADETAVNETADYESTVYHCANDNGTDAFLRGSATVGPLDPDDPERGRIELSEFFLTETAWVFYHERGHNLGFRHSGGIMDYDQPDADPSEPLDRETKVIANHTEGLHYVNWASEDSANEMLAFVVGEWSVGNADDETLQYAIRRWSGGTNDDVYADNTIAEQFEDEIPAYGNETRDRSVATNAFYRNETTKPGGAWR